MHDWAEFRHFRYLLAILEKRGFRAAAEELHTSQPNLTVQARQFQENAGICLFQRSKTGRIRPTESGTAFVGLARHLLDVRDEVIEAISAIDRGDISSVCCASSSLIDPELFRQLCAMQKALLPTIPIRPTHGDLPHLVEELEAGTIDIALLTLPLIHPHLHIERFRSDRLVACIRKDSPLALKAALSAEDIQKHLRVFYHPQKHPDAHERLVQLLDSANVRIREFSRASHPSEMQTLVREGFGAALIREGMPIHEELTTRPISGVDWTLDSALVYHKVRHPKTVPILARQFKRQFGKAQDEEPTPSGGKASPRRVQEGVIRKPDDPVQLTLLR